MNWLRVMTVVRRHWYVLWRSPNRWFDIAVWPVFDVLLFGSLGAFVAQGLPETDGVSPSVHGRTRAVLGRLSALQGRAMGRLAVVAQRIERAAGFEPVPPDA